MPRKPRFIHPLRQVRTCLSYSQTAFAKRIGCSPITVQRIENGTLQLSSKLANIIMDATGVNPASLRAGKNAKAMDMMGNEYSKDSYQFYKGALPYEKEELMYYLHKIISYAELLLIASQRGTRFKTHAIFSEIQEMFRITANNFDLKHVIEKFLIEKGRVRKRIYRVSDLRKFPDYAQIIGFKDEKRYSPAKLVEFNLPEGWIHDFAFLNERPILPQGADMKLAGNADFIIDQDRAIPKEIEEAVAQAIYWEIEDFRIDFSES